MKLILVFFFSLICYQIYGQRLSLETVLPTDKFMVDEKIELKLRIEDIPNELIIPKEGFEVETQNQFVYKFYITPKENGKLLLGPYSINFNDKKLESNQLELHIKAKLKANDIKIKSPSRAGIGEEIIIELTSTKENLAKIRILESKNFKGGFLSSSSNSTYKDGIMTTYYSVRFRLTFDIAGEYEINESCFENIPENLNLRSEKIKIK